MEAIIFNKKPNQLRDVEDIEESKETPRTSALEKGFWQDKIGGTAVPDKGQALDQ